MKSNEYIHQLKNGNEHIRIFVHKEERLLMSNVPRFVIVATIDGDYTSSSAAATMKAQATRISLFAKPSITTVEQIYWSKRLSLIYKNDPLSADDVVTVHEPSSQSSGIHPRRTKLVPKNQVFGGRHSHVLVPL